MKKQIISTILVIIWAASFPQIINIPDDFPTIQLGINAASNGDTVLVDQGNYFENINYYGKNITVASHYLITPDPSYIVQTIIDGNQAGSVVRFETDEDSTALLCGFTITNGYNDNGGGILVDSASPKLEYLNIMYNEANYGGGGLSFNNSGSKLCSINVSYNSGGGIEILWESNLIMDGLIIKYNNYNGKGAGIHCYGTSNLTLKNSHITGNTLFSAYPSGGGFYIGNNCNVNLQNVVIANNSAGNPCAPAASGGGICCEGSTIVLSGVTIKNNAANFKGGGLASWSSEIFFDSGNKSSIYANNAPIGHDIYVYNPVEITKVILDTFSVVYPTDYYAEPSKYFDFEIDHGLVQQINDDLYVSANGSNLNSGLTESEPLLNIQYALSILRVDSLYPHHIYLLPGIYSPSLTQEYFPINIPDFCHFIGSNANEVVLSAEQWGNVINLNHNFNNHISKISITEGKGGFTAGGITCTNSNPLLTNLIIENNFNWNPALSQGGGILMEFSNPVLINVLIANNYAWVGGGVYISNSNPILTNVSFSGNSNGGLQIHGNSNVVMQNTIMWGDSVSGFPEIRLVNTDTCQASISILRSDIYGGLEGIVTLGNNSVYWLEGNLDEDPLFAGIGEHPYELSDGSPCIDAGTPDTTGLNLPYGDIIGNKRIWDGNLNGVAIVDIGAYEFGSIPVGVQEPQISVQVSDFKVRCYPNPADTKIIVELSVLNNHCQMSIFNFHGEKVLERQLTDTETQLDISALRRGVYFVRVQNEKRVAAGKLVIQ